MNGYERIHPPAGYGLGRHSPARPAQSAQELAAGTAGAPPPAPAAPDTTPAGRARALLSSRRPAASPSAPEVRTPPAPSLAAPPAAAPPASPLAKPPEPAQAPSPLSAPPAAPAPGQIVDNKLYGADGRMIADFTPNPRGLGGFGDARDNPNNTMSVFEDPVTHQQYSDFDNPALRVSPGGTFVRKDATTTWDPTSIYTDPSSPFYQGARDVKPPPIVDSIPPPDQLPPGAGAADDSRLAAAALHQISPGANAPTFRAVKTRVG